MREYYFAGYRLLADGEIAVHDSEKSLAGFTDPMPYTHTFTLRMGDARELEERRAYALACPLAYETEYFTIHDTGDGWAFVDTPADMLRFAEGIHRIVLCSRDYGDITVYVTDTPYYTGLPGQYKQATVPLSGSIRTACEAGMVLRDGLPLHASLVEKTASAWFSSVPRAWESPRRQSCG